MNINMPKPKGPNAMARLAGPIGGALGAGVGFVASGFNPAGAMAGGTIGGKLGEAVGGAAGGDAGQAINGATQAGIGAAGLMHQKEKDERKKQLGEAFLKLNPTFDNPIARRLMELE